MNAIRNVLTSTCRVLSFGSEINCNPSPDPSDRIQTESWQHVKSDRAVKRGPGGSVALDKVSDIYSVGVTATMHPGAEFTLEVKKVKVRER